MEEKIIIAGFGGQGVMAMGQMITYSGMIEEKHVSWLPSYGPEMRGGTANCNVIVSDNEVASPVIANDATTAIVLNKPSLDKFEDDIKEGGKLFINSSLIEEKATREDLEVYYVPANDIANELGNIRVANMVMLGAYLEVLNLVDMDSIYEAFGKVFGESKMHLLPMNKEALTKGREIIRVGKEVLV